MKTALIYNPYSGKGISKKMIDEILDILKDRGYDVTLYKTEYAHHATKIVESLKNITLVLSMGGDGTLNEVITGNYNRKDKLTIGHIPVGTTNDIGRMYGYEKNIIKNLKLVLDGTVKNVDICTINNKPFIYSAGFGKFVKIAYDTPKKLKKKFGYLAYLKSGLKEFNVKTKLYDLDYYIDGKKYYGRYSFIMIANATSIAGIKWFGEDVKLNDKKFEVIFCNLTQKSDILKGFYYLSKSNITKVGGFDIYRTDNLKIEFHDKNETVWSLDGEKHLEDFRGIEFDISTSMPLLIPSKNIKNLFL